jgi:hypothetical protein
MQVSAVVAPSFEEYFPALQSTHSFFVNSSSLAARYLPAAHVVHKQGEPPHSEAHEKQHLVHTLSNQQAFPINPPGAYDRQMPASLDNPLAAFTCSGLQ